MAAVSPNADPQIAPASQSDAPASPNETGIAANGAETRDDEEVFADAPEAPVDDQKCVLVDKGAAFGGFGELGESSEFPKGFDGEFGDFEGKDGILGGEDRGDVESSEDFKKDGRRVEEVSVEVVGENENFSVREEKAENLAGEIGVESSFVIDEDKVEKFEEVENYVKEGTVDEKKIDGEFVSGEGKDDASSDRGLDEKSLVDASKGAENEVEEFNEVATSVNEGLADTKKLEDESVIGEAKEDAPSDSRAKEDTIFYATKEVEKFEEVATSVDEGTIDTKKIEDESVTGVAKKDVSSDVEPNEESLLQEDAIVDATKGAENKVATSVDEGTVNTKKVEDESVIGEAKEDVPIDDGSIEEGFLQEDVVVDATKEAEDEISGEVNQDVARDDVSKEENLLQGKVDSNSFEKANVGAGGSADNDENRGEEKKATSSDDVPKEKSLVQEQVNSAAVPEQEKSYAGSSEKGVETVQAAASSETNKGVGVPELATEGVNVVSIQDKQLAPTLADDSESREAECLDLAPSSVQASASAAETEQKEANGVSTNVYEDHTLQDNDEVEEVLDALEVAQELDNNYSNNSPYSQLDSSKHIDGQIASDSDAEVETDEENSDREIIDADTLTALLKAARSSANDGGVNITSQDGNRVFMFDRPAGLGPSIPSLRPAPSRPARSILSASETAMTAVPDNDMTEEEKILHDKVEQIKVKFLRLVQRLGHSPEDTVAAQVLYRLSLAEGIRHGRQTNRAFGLENAKKKALQLENDGKEALDFSCNILVVGKGGVGKSATINSIFGGEKSHTDAFAPATDSVKEIIGIVDGVKVRVIDTPGLHMSMMDQASNRKVLLAIKKYTKKCPPDIVLYVDRMDSQTRDLNDLPLLKSIANTLGPSIWFNAIVALTHAASAPPDGPSGAPLSYEVYVAQRSHIIQQSIRLAAGDMRLMNPVALVENHQSCRKNREGQKVLPNGLAWRPQMLLLCYSSKILAEANSLLKLQDPSPKKLFNFRFRSPPLPFLLSSLLQSKAHPKLTPEQGGEAVDSDIDLDDLSDSDQEDEEDEYDQLPAFKPLSKAQIAKLTKEQRKSYFDEYDYRVKLLQKKQWKDELKRMKEMKKGGKKAQDDFGYGQMAEDFEQDSAPATVPVPLPDMVLPPSFDCEAPTYRYRFLEPTSHLLARPVLDTHGWDHDCGYDGVSLEESLAIASRFPAVISAQVTKDKKEFSIHMESSVSAKHGESGSSLAGFNIQAVGKQLAYTLLGESKFKNFKKNKTTGGFSVTFLGETVATGLKLEDQLSIGKRVTLVSSAGAVRSQSDTAYGANLEARLQDKEYPIGQTLTTLGLSLMKWHSDLALGANLQSQFSVGRNSKMAIRVGLNNKLTGQITVKTSSSEHLQLALVSIIPVALTIYRNIMSGME